MTDLLIWFGTIAFAFIILRFSPLNMSVKARMVLWLTGSLISSLALLASLTYTFWIGMVSALVLAFLFTVLLQEKAPGVFEFNNEKGSSMEHPHSPTTDDFDHWYNGAKEEDATLESGEGEESTNFLSNEEEPKLNQRESTEELKEQKVDPELGKLDDEKEVSQPSNKIVLDELFVEDNNPQEEELNAKTSGGEWPSNDDQAAANEEESLLEEELVQSRMNEETTMGLEEEPLEEETEEELMSERNQQLDFEAAELDSIEDEDLSIEKKDEERIVQGDENEESGRILENELMTDSAFEDSHLELEPIEDEVGQSDLENTEGFKMPYEGSNKEIIEESKETTDFDKDITREMNNADNALEGKYQEEVSVPSINYSSDPDIEDNEDSLSLEEDNEEELIADEALRKQLLELMIEKIEHMEEGMSGSEYENYVKAHLSENLPDLEYYSISNHLIKHYIKHQKIDELELFVGGLIDKFNSYSLIVEQLQYVLQQQVQYTK